MKLEVSGQTATVDLAPGLDIFVAEELLALFVEADNKGFDLNINAGGVEKASTACLQIIHSAAVSCIESDRTFQITDASDALVTSFKDLGLYSKITMRS
ncbi:STAS domain-containing protein [Kiloniella sp. EL199]|uniref:STAS domain-containing protein n=1 Tax=Kiloniella sp. EL199 TaxID=2107581 RepID=UPI000EA2A2EC|nr:STAS domain-containing protein [Kiloniella sp. EL199]